MPLGETQNVEYERVVSTSNTNGEHLCLPGTVTNIPALVIRQK